MKSLKDYSMNLPEQEYHDYPAWSHSLIARYAREGFSAIATIHDKVKTTSAMEFGSLFDSILTRGKDTLNEYVVDDTTAPPAETAVFDRLLSEGHNEPFNEISISDLMTAMEACKFYPSYKPETRIEKLNKASEYYNVRRLGKKIVSKEDWNDAIEMAHVFRDDKYLSVLFGTKNTNEIEYIYQPQFLVDLDIEGEKVKVKVMFDLLVVNHKDKTIQPVDLKTSQNPAYSFSENFIKWRYDLEAETYTDALARLIETKATEYQDYTILPYLFTDISRTDKVPVTYMYDPRNGFAYTKGDKTYQYKGWKELLAEILAYEANEAKVPNYITTEGPNDLIEILSR